MQNPAGERSTCGASFPAGTTPERLRDWHHDAGGVWTCPDCGRPTLTDFISEHAIKLQALRISARTHGGGDWHRDARHWHCTLWRRVDGLEPATMAVEFTCGPGCEWGYQQASLRELPRPPKLLDVLDCMRSDAETAEEYPDAYDFAEALGYLDGRAASARRGMATHAGCLEQTRRLKDWLEPARFAELLTCEPE